MNWKKDDTFLAKWLSGDLTEEEKIAFEESAEGKEFNDLIDAADQIEAPGLNVDDGLVKLKSQIDSYNRKPTSIRMRPVTWLSIAASFSIIVIALYLIFSETTVKTGFSEQQLVTLPDGSEVQMNVASEISYAEKGWENERLVKLSGEAFFNVYEGVPFTVKTIHGDVSVLGTSFNIRSRGEILKVSCFSGSVQVSSDKQSRQLEAGQTIRIQNAKIIEFKNESLDSAPAWMSGIIKLENMPFTEVLQELRYVFNIEIEYNQPLNHLIYTGSFSKNDLNTAFSLVFEPLKVDYTYDDASRTLTIKGPMK